MNYLFQFYDSEVSKIISTEQVVEIQFSAARVKALQGDVCGYVSGLVIVLRDTTTSASESASFGRILEGTLASDGRKHRDIALPFIKESTGGLELLFANQSRFCCEFQAVEISISDEGTFFESLMC